MNRLPEAIVDFHVHLFPDKLFDAIWLHFSKFYNWNIIQKIYYQQCVAHLRQKQVGPIVYSNYAHKKGVAESLNQWNLQILDEIPDLYCFAAYHPDDDNALEIAIQALSHPRVLGFKLQLLVQNFYPDDKRLFPLYDLVVERNKRILFHVGTGPMGNKYVGIKNFKKLLTHFPELPANIAHMGGLEYSSFFDLLKHHPGIYFDTSYSFFKNADFSFDLDTSSLELNKDRIVYGSDFPNVIYPREEEIDCLLKLDLSAEFYHQVFKTNGEYLIQCHTQ